MGYGMNKVGLNSGDITQLAAGHPVVGPTGFWYGKASTSGTPT
jgi:hypothetical protein